MGEADGRHRARFDAIKTTDTLRVTWILIYFYICGADLPASVTFSALARVHRDLKTAKTVEKRIDCAQRADKTTERPPGENHPD
jgi:hypothetical protein